MWTVARAMVWLRVHEVSAERVARGRRRRVAPVSPAPVRGLPAVPRSRTSPDGADRSAPSLYLSPDTTGRTVMLEPVLDTPTTLLKAVEPPSADLWDDELHLGRRRVHHIPTVPVRRFAHILIPIALTCLVGAIGLGRPALWTDELATWGMATTPWSEFWSVLRYVDAVLAPYYTLMHLWVDVFGDSDVALRTPSLLAMAGAAGLVAAIGTHLSGRTAGLLGGTVFALLAATSRFAAEARPYAFTVLTACAATWLLLRAWQRPTWLRWLAYGAAVALLGWFQLVALLLVAGHAWTTLAWHRRLWGRFAAAAGTGFAASLAILVYGYRQRGQIAYIGAVDGHTVDTYTAVLFGGTSVALLVVALALFSRPLRMSASVATAWALVPTAGLLAVSTVLPMFLPRYLVFTTPGWALLAGLALARVKPAWAVAGVVLLAGLAAPAHLQMRAPAGHGQDTRELAFVVGAGVQTGDGVVYADNEPVGGWTARDAIAHYLPAAYRPQDVLATSPQRTRGQLLAAECLDARACLGDGQRLWVVRTGTLADPLAGIGPSKEDILRTEYRVVQLWHPAGLTVALLERISDEAS